MGNHNAGIAGPELFDGKMGAKEAALRPEYGDGFLNDVGDVRGIISLNEGSKPGEFAHDIWLSGQSLYAFLPRGPAPLDLSSSMPACCKTNVTPGNAAARFAAP
jgi:hypothetical protein